MLTPVGVGGQRDSAATNVRTRGIAAVAVLAVLALGGTARANHGGDSDHLPPVSKNVEIVSKLEPASQGPVANRQIDDLTVHDGFAYLQSGSNCGPAGGGFYAIDIRNPAAPSEVSFTAAAPNTYHGEGAHAVSIGTPAFSGDLLAVSNEACPGHPNAGGGFDLYDVSDPADPVPLTEGFGDFGGEGTLTGPEPIPHGSQSIFIWDAGAKAYAAVVDNEELHALDIFEITDPESPQPVGEYNLRSEAPPETDAPNGNNPFMQDMVVKPIDGRWMLLASYFDGGYVLVDVTDPAAAEYVADSDFGTSDPLTGFDPPEGNAHYAEFTHDNEHIVTAEQDIQPYRLTQVEVESQGDFAAGAVTGGAMPSDLPDGRLNGPMAYGGYACQDTNPAGDEPQPVPLAETTFPEAGLEEGEEQILVVQRGPDGDPNEDYDGDGDTTDTDDACFPGTKADTAADAGWDAIVIINRHEDGGEGADSAFCGSGGYQEPFVTACTTHAAGHAIFDDPASYDRPYDDQIEMAPVGTVSNHELDATSVFDGWGYMGLYGTSPGDDGKLPREDSYAIPEAMNPDYAQGFGELSIHEQAADPTEPLSYASYRSAGLRVFSFEAGKITPQGAFIDSGGNDLWGVEQFTTGNGERLIAASDRDYGLYIFRYTGPLAPERPTCANSGATVPAGGTVTVALVCTDENGNPLTRQIVSGPSAGTLGPVNQADGTVSYTNTDEAATTDSFRFAANDGAATSAPATVTLTIESSPDTTAPETTIDKRPKNEVRGSKAKFKFSSSEPDSSFECKLDRGKYKPCTSPRKLKRLEPGKHKFSVRATDAAGNTDPKPAKDKFRVV